MVTKSIKSRNFVSVLSCNCYLGLRPFVSAPPLPSPDGHKVMIKKEKECIATEHMGMQI